MQQIIELITVINNEQSYLGLQELEKQINKITNIDIKVNPIETKSVEKSVKQLNNLLRNPLKIKVDDTRLFELNDHYDEKIVDHNKVVDNAENNPIKVKVDYNNNNPTLTSGNKKESAIPYLKIIANNTKKGLLGNILQGGLFSLGHSIVNRQVNRFGASDKGQKLINQIDTFLDNLTNSFAKNIGGYTGSLDPIGDMLEDLANLVQESENLSAYIEKIRKIFVKGFATKNTERFNTEIVNEVIKFQLKFKKQINNAFFQILKTLAIPVRLNTEAKIYQSADDIASQDLSQSKNIDRITSKYSSEIEDKNIVTLTIGGFQKERGSASNELAEMLRPIFDDKTGFIPIPNVYTDRKSNHTKSSLNDALVGNFGDVLGQEGLSMVMNVEKLLGSALKGINPDAIRMASVAIAIQEKYPNKKIQLAGFSGGGFVVEQAIGILEAMGKSDIKGIGFGSPLLGLADVASKENYMAMVGKTDALSFPYADGFTGGLSEEQKARASDFGVPSFAIGQGFVTPPESVNYLQDFVGVHDMQSYLGSKSGIKTLGQFLAGVKPSIKTGQLSSEDKTDLMNQVSIDNIDKLNDFINNIESSSIDLADNNKLVAQLGNIGQVVRKTLIGGGLPSSVPLKDLYKTLSTTDKLTNTQKKELFGQVTTLKEAQERLTRIAGIIQKLFVSNFKIPKDVSKEDKVIFQEVADKSYQESEIGQFVISVQSEIQKYLNLLSSKALSELNISQEDINSLDPNSLSSIAGYLSKRYTDDPNILRGIEYYQNPTQEPKTQGNYEFYHPAEPAKRVWSLGEYINKGLIPLIQDLTKEEQSIFEPYITAIKQLQKELKNYVDSGVAVSEQTIQAIQDFSFAEQKIDFKELSSIQKSIKKDADRTNKKSRKQNNFTSQNQTTNNEKKPQSINQEPRTEFNTEPSINEDKLENSLNNFLDLLESIENIATKTIIADKIIVSRIENNKSTGTTSNNSVNSQSSLIPIAQTKPKTPELITVINNTVKNTSSAITVVKKFGDTVQQVGSVTGKAISPIYRTLVTLEKIAFTGLPLLNPAKTAIQTVAPIGLGAVGMGMLPPEVSSGLIHLAQSGMGQLTGVGAESLSAAISGILESSLGSLPFNITSSLTSGVSSLLTTSAESLANVGGAGLAMWSAGKTMQNIAGFPFAKIGHNYSLPYEESITPYYGESNQIQGTNLTPLLNPAQDANYNIPELNKLDSLEKLTHYLSRNSTILNPKTNKQIQLFTKDSLKRLAIDLGANRGDLVDRETITKYITSQDITKVVQALSNFPDKYYNPKASPYIQKELTGQTTLPQYTEKTSELISQSKKWMQKLTQEISQVTSVSGLREKMVDYNKLNTNTQNFKRLLPTSRSLNGQNTQLEASLKKAIINIARNLNKTLADNISFEEAVKTLGEETKELPEIVKQILGIQSPSKVFMQIGQNIVEGLNSGLDNTSLSDQIINELIKLKNQVNQELGVNFSSDDFKQYQNRLKLAIRNISNQDLSDVSQIGETIQKLILEGFDNNSVSNTLANSINDTVDNIVSSIDTVGDQIVDTTRNIAENAMAEIEGFNFNRFNQRIEESINRLAENNPVLANILTTVKDNLGKILQLGISALGIGVLTDLFTKLATGAFDAALQVENLERSLAFSTGKNGALELQRIRKEADLMGISFINAAEGLRQFSASTIGSSMAENAPELVSQFQKSFAAYGLNTDQQEGSFLAISQMASKGVVSMEELRQQLAERLPGALNAAARSMGMSLQQFQKLVSSGQVLSEDLLPALASQLETESFLGLATSANSTQAELIRLQNNIFNIQSALGQVALTLTKLGLPVVNKSLQILVGSVDELAMFTSTFLVTSLVGLSLQLTTSTLVSRAFKFTLDALTFSAKKLWVAFAPLLPYAVVAVGLTASFKLLNSYFTAGSKEIKTYTTELAKLKNVAEDIKGIEPTKPKTTVGKQDRDLRLKNSLKFITDESGASGRRKGLKTYGESFAEEWDEILDFITWRSLRATKAFMVNIENISKSNQSALDLYINALTNTKTIDIGEGITVTNNYSDETIKKVQERLADLRNQQSNFSLQIALIADLGDEELIRSLTEQKAEIEKKIQKVMNEPFADLGSIQKAIIAQKNEIASIYLEIENLQGNKGNYSEENFTSRMNAYNMALSESQKRLEDLQKIEDKANKAKKENIDLYTKQIQSLRILLRELSRIDYTTNLTNIDSQIELNLSKAKGEISSREFEGKIRLAQTVQVQTKLELSTKEFNNFENDLTQKLSKLDSGLKDKIANYIGVDNLDDAILNKQISAEALTQLTGDLVPEDIKNVVESSGELKSLVNVAQQYLTTWQDIKQQQLDSANLVKENADAIKQQRLDARDFTRQLVDFDLQVKDYFINRSRQLQDFEKNFTDTSIQNQRGTRDLVESFRDLRNTLNTNILNINNQLITAKNQLSNLADFNEIRGNFKLGSNGLLNQFTTLLEGIFTSEESLNEQTRTLEEERLALQQETTDYARQIRGLGEQAYDLERDRINQLIDLTRQQDDFIKEQNNSWRDITKTAEDLAQTAKEWGVQFTSIADILINITGMYERLQSQINDSVNNMQTATSVLPYADSVGVGKLGGAKGTGSSSTAPHLHFEVIAPNGRALNPKNTDYYNKVMIGDTAINQMGINSGHGMRKHPIKGIQKFHTGIDVGGQNNLGQNITLNIPTSEIKKIEQKNDVGGYGKYTDVTLMNDYKLRFAHLLEHGKQLTEITSNLTKTTNNFNKDDAKSIASAFIKQEEGFRDKAYFDVNRYRIGYGTEFKGNSPNSYRASSTITKAEADNQLENYDIPRFTDIIKGQLGDIFNQLSEQIKASLISVSYNYGSLPSKVVNAVKTKNTATIANSIRTLQANPERRNREADLVLSSSQNKIKEVISNDRTTNQHSNLSSISSRNSVSNISSSSEFKSVEKQIEKVITTFPDTVNKAIDNVDRPTVKSLIEFLDKGQKIPTDLLREVLNLKDMGNYEGALELMKTQVKDFTQLKTEFINVRQKQVEEQRIAEEFQKAQELRQNVITVNETIRNIENNYTQLQQSIKQAQIETQGFTTTQQSLDIAVAETKNKYRDLRQQVRSFNQEIENSLDVINLDNLDKAKEELTLLKDKLAINLNIIPDGSAKEKMQEFIGLIEKGLAENVNATELLITLKAKFDKLGLEEQLNQIEKEAEITVKTKTEYETSNKLRSDLSNIYSNISNNLKEFNLIKTATNFEINARELESLNKYNQTIFDTNTLIQQLNQEIAENPANKEYLEAHREQLIKVKSEAERLREIEKIEIPIKIKTENAISEMQNLSNTLKSIGERKAEVNPFFGGSNEQYLAQILDIQAKYKSLEQELRILAQSEQNVFDKAKIEEYRGQLGELEQKELRKLEIKMSKMGQLFYEPFKQATKDIMLEVSRGTKRIEDVLLDFANSVLAKLADMASTSITDTIFDWIIPKKSDSKQDNKSDLASFVMGELFGKNNNGGGNSQGNGSGYRLEFLPFTNEDKANSDLPFTENLSNSVNSFTQNLSSNSIQFAESLSQGSLDFGNAISNSSNIISSSLGNFVGLLSGNSGGGGFWSGMAKAVISGAVGGVGGGSLGSSLADSFIGSSNYSFASGTTIKGYSTGGKVEKISMINNFSMGGKVQEMMIPNFSMGGKIMPQIENFSDGGQVKALNLGLGMLEAMKREGTNAVPVVAYAGESFLSHKTGDAQLYEDLKRTGVWDMFKHNPSDIPDVKNYEYGGTVERTYSKMTNNSSTNTYNNSRSKETNNNSVKEKTIIMMPIEQSKFIGSPSYLKQKEKLSR